MHAHADAAQISEWMDGEPPKYAPRPDTIHRVTLFASTARLRNTAPPVGKYMGENHHPPKVADRSRRWVVLGCAGVSYALNCFMWMSYSGTPTVSKDVLSPSSTPISSEDLDWTYSASLTAVVLFMMPAAYLIKWRNYSMMCASVCLNIGAAWLRYLSAVCASYALAISSAVLLGGATAVMMPAFALLPEVWFPVQQRALATALGVQSWYAGWALGALVIPLVVSDAASMRLTMLVQAAVTTLSLPLFLCAYASEPPARALGSAARGSAPLPRGAVDGDAAEAEAEEEEELEEELQPQLSEGGSLRAIGANFQFWVHAVSYGLLAGISFALPAITANVFADCMHPALTFVSEQSMWINFGFIASGVVGGVLIGAFTTDASQATVIRLCALTCAAALSLLVAVTHLPALADRLGGDGIPMLIVLVVLVSAAGAASLGFFALGLRSAARIGAPVPHVYSAGITETLSQLLAVSITQSSVCPIGFKACAICAALVTVALVALARFPKPATSLAAADSATATHRQGMVAAHPATLQAEAVHAVRIPAGRGDAR